MFIKRLKALQKNKDFSENQKRFYLDDTPYTAMEVQLFLQYFEQMCWF